MQTARQVLSVGRKEKNDATQKIKLGFDVTFITHPDFGIDRLQRPE
jgi:hypothetical protein